MSFKNPNLVLIIVNLLLPAALIIFATGFFPYKSFIPGFASFQQHDQHGLERVSAPFDKVIYMVVDALRR